MNARTMALHASESETQTVWGFDSHRLGTVSTCPQQQTPTPIAKDLAPRGVGHLARLAAEWVARLGAKPTGSWLQLKLVTDLRKALCLSEPQNCEMRV